MFEIDQLFECWMKPIGTSRQTVPIVWIVSDHIVCASIGEIVEAYVGWHIATGLAIGYVRKWTFVSGRFSYNVKVAAGR